MHETLNFRQGGSSTNNISSEGFNPTQKKELKEMIDKFLKGGNLDEYGDQPIVTINIEE